MKASQLIINYNRKQALENCSIFYLNINIYIKNILINLNSLQLLNNYQEVTAF